MKMLLKNRSRTAKIATSIASLSALAITLMPAQAFALVGARSYSDPYSRDVYLGGSYIEVGISKLGSLGTHRNFVPMGFYGSEEHTNIAFNNNPTGFGVEPDLRHDYILPGSPEQRWSVGYTISEEQFTGANTLLEGKSDISNTVKNKSIGNQLKATSTGKFNNKLKITQDITFGSGDRYFKNTVTLQNISGGNLDAVRFMSSLDPDNTVDLDGSYQTHNEILMTNAAGDGRAAIMADTSNIPNDPVFLINGTHSPLYIFSKDSRARVSAFGFGNSDPYAADAYDEAPAKGFSINDDIAISIAFDVGTLTNGQSTTFTYFTSADNRGNSIALRPMK